MMLDVDKQQEWEDPFTGKVKKNIPTDCYRPIKNDGGQFEKEWNEWFSDNEQEAF